MNLEKCGYVWMCLCGLGRGGSAALKKKKQIRKQDFAISNQHLVCKFEEVGWDIHVSKKNPGKLFALPHKLVVVVGGGVKLCIEIGLRGKLACYFVKKIERYLAAEIILYQNFFSMKDLSLLQQLESFYRSCSVHVMWWNASAIVHD